MNKSAGKLRRIGSKISYFFSTSAVLAKDRTKQKTRMHRSPWAARKTNLSSLKKPSVTKRLFSLVIDSILSYFGHIVRRHYGTERLVVEDRILGRRPLAFSQQDGFVGLKY